MLKILLQYVVMQNHVENSHKSQVLKSYGITNNTRNFMQ